MLTLDDDQRLIGESVGRALAARDSATERARLRETNAFFSPELWEDCVAIGLPGILVTEALGGLGFGVAGAVMASEAFGLALAPVPFLSSAVVGGALVSALAEAGSPRGTSYLAKLLSGGLLFALGVGTSEDSDVRLTPTDAGWLLQGEVRFVEGACAATLLGVVAHGPDAPMLAFVEMPAIGARVDARPLIDERDGASVRFDGCTISREAAIPAGSHIVHARDVARLCLASEMLGLCDAALAMTVDYVRQRRQFDRHIGSFQTIQHRLAILHCEIELLRSTMLGGIEAADSGRFPFAAALAKAKASRLGPMVMNECLQLHGGVGMTDAFAIGHFLKRAKVLAASFGDEDACLETLMACEAPEPTQRS